MEALHEITIKDRSGQVLCRVHYRLDGSLRRRGKACKRQCVRIVKPLRKIDEINADGSGATDRAQKALDRAERELVKCINTALGTDEAEALFTRRRPFASVGGTFFCVRVVEALGREMEREVTGA